MKQQKQHVSITPQKPIHRASSSSMHFSPLTNCINLPFSQNSNIPKNFYYKYKNDPENRLNSSRILSKEAFSQRIQQTPEKNDDNFSNSTINTIFERNFIRNPSFDANLMKEIQGKFKKLLEENEKLQCDLIQRNNFIEENSMNQNIANKQIFDLETSKSELIKENTTLKGQLEDFQHQNQCNLQILQETEEKMLVFLKNNENNKAANKGLTFENIALKKNIEEFLLKINGFQGKIKQDSLQLQKCEEIIAKLAKDHDSNQMKYSELQQNFVLEKNLHSQSEKNLKNRLQTLENDLKASEEKNSEINENLMKVQKDLNEKRDKIQILEYRLEENQAEFANLQDIESRILDCKHDNEKLLDMVSCVRKEKEFLEKELNSKENEMQELFNEVIAFRKKNDEMKNSIEFYKKNEEEFLKNKGLLERGICEKNGEIQELINLNETWENKINLLICEAERLSSVIKEKDVFVENLQRDYHLCDKELKKSQNSNVDFSKKIADFESKLLQDQKIKEQLEIDKKAIIHFYEDNRVKQDREIEIYKGKYNGIIKEFEESRQRFEEFKSFKIEDKSSQLRFEAEKSTFETEIIQMKNKIIEYEIAYNALLKKTEDLHSRNNENHCEREGLQKDFGEKMENFEKENANMMRIVEKLKSNLYEKDEIIGKLENSKKKTDGQIKEFKEIIQINNEEIDSLVENSNKKSYENEVLEGEFEKSKKEIAYLLKENKEIKKNLTKFKEEENCYKKTIEILTNTSKDYKGQIDQYSGEINMKNKELIGKIEDLDRMKENYSKTVEKIEVLETKLLNKLQQK